MAMPATQIRRGMVLVFEGDPCRVIEFRHHTPGNLRAMVQAKLKNLRTGSSFEHRFRAADAVERASMETHQLEFMYKGGDSYHFMNTETYDQICLTKDVLGEAVDYLIPNIHLNVEFFDGKPMGVALPDTVDLTVVDTEPTVQKATASAVMKPAKLETGLVIQVPPFINNGDRVRVDTSEGRYVQRAQE